LCRERSWLLVLGAKVSRARLELALTISRSHAERESAIASEATRLSACVKKITNGNAVPASLPWQILSVVGCDCEEHFKDRRGS